MANKANFGQFLSSLANKPDSAIGNGVLESLKAKLEKERADRVESKLRQVFQAIEDRVSRIRSYRKTIKIELAEIEKLETRANAIVNGKDESD